MSSREAGYGARALPAWPNKTRGIGKPREYHCMTNVRIAFTKNCIVRNERR